MEVPQYLIDKRDELIWALADKNQGYSVRQIAAIFNSMPVSSVHDVMKRKPSDWSTPWVKK